MAATGSIAATGARRSKRGGRRFAVVVSGGVFVWTGLGAHGQGVPIEPTRGLEPRTPSLRVTGYAVILASLR